MSEGDNTRPADHLYPFVGFRSRLLFTGCRRDGEQFLAGPYPPATLILRFAPTGQLLGAVEDLLPDIPDRDALERQVEGCFRRLGAMPGPIRMRRFNPKDAGSPLAGLGVQVEVSDWPLGLEYPDGWSLVDGEPNEYTLERERWIQSGAYVLEWGDALYVGGNGVVFST
jgi:hypothetical protein